MVGEFNYCVICWLDNHKMRVEINRLLDGGTGRCKSH